VRQRGCVPSFESGRALLEVVERVKALGRLRQQPEEIRAKDVALARPRDPRREP
jgi:hypothetical protein